MIPKTIHYCWFGGNPLPELAQKCIASWKEHCSGYTIIQWDEDNFDLESNTYIKEAYQAKKWAFITDYVRLFVILKYGGIYMDTDVEVLKPIDGFLVHSAFSGFENNSTSFGLGTACSKSTKRTGTARSRVSRWRYGRNWTVRYRYSRVPSP